MGHIKYTLILLMISFSCFSQSRDEQEIRSLLDQQTISWNKGDLVEFMKGYWKSDSLMFIGKSGVTYGYTNTLENYKRNYQGEAQMGKLSFNLIKVEKLCEDHYFVLGKWMLKRTAGDVSGHYTLIFKKIDGRWVIISDHSS
jgi:hypothetical protein